MKSIKKYLVISFLLICSFPTFAATKTQQLVSLLSNIHAMQADFQQVLIDQKSRILQKSSGTMALERPNLFYWQIKQPDRQLIVADGHYLWVYDEALQQVTKHPIKHNEPGTPAALLSSSVSDLQKRFAVSLLKHTANSQWFQLVPRQKNGAFNWVQLHFSGKQLVEMRFADNLGQISNLHFTKIQTNLPLPPHLFQFKAKAGVDVIDD